MSRNDTNSQVAASHLHRKAIYEHTVQRMLVISVLMVTTLAIGIAGLGSLVA